MLKGECGMLNGDGESGFSFRSQFRWVRCLSAEEAVEQGERDGGEDEAEAPPDGEVDAGERRLFHRCGRERGDADEAAVEEEIGGEEDQTATGVSAGNHLATTCVLWK